MGKGQLRACATPSIWQVHISYLGPIPKGKEWMALGRLSAPSVLPQLKMEFSDDFLDFCESFL